MFKRLKNGTKMLSVIMASILLLTGCTFGTGIETLLLPPKLSDEQTAINQALIASAGKDIKLKYPKSGDYRSAFIVANIDDEPLDEAIVFYERTGINNGESNIRMDILDKRDGKWVSVTTHPGMGTEVEKIMFSKLGVDGQITILAGYTMINQKEKVLEAYSYAGGELKTIYSDHYSDFEVMDMNKDTYNELVMITNSTANISARTTNAANASNTTAAFASAKLLIRSGDSFEVASEVGMDETAVEYSSAVQGNVGTDTPALFVDSTIGDGQIQTQILYCVDGKLSNPLDKRREVLSKTVRPIGYESSDIDKDGVVEIPTLSPFPGYETVDEAEQICVTDWYVFEKYALIKKNSGYYNISKSYCFMLPSRWQGTVTLKSDVANDEIVFYKYDGAITDDMVELMRISVMKRGTNSEKLAHGYQTLVSKGQMDYMVKIANNKSEPLVLTKSEIMFNFYALQ